MLYFIVCQVCSDPFPVGWSFGPCSVPSHHMLTWSFRPGSILDLVSPHLCHWIPVYSPFILPCVSISRGRQPWNYLYGFPLEPTIRVRLQEQKCGQTSSKKGFAFEKSPEKNNEFVLELEHHNKMVFVSKKI